MRFEIYIYKKKKKSLLGNKITLGNFGILEFSFVLVILMGK